MNHVQLTNTFVILYEKNTFLWSTVKTAGAPSPCCLCLQYIYISITYPPLQILHTDGRIYMGLVLLPWRNLPSLLCQWQPCISKCIIIPHITLYVCTHACARVHALLQQNKVNECFSSSRCKDLLTSISPHHERQHSHTLGQDQ